MILIQCRAPSHSATRMNGGRLLKASGAILGLFRQRLWLRPASTIVVRGNAYVILGIFKLVYCLVSLMDAIFWHENHFWKYPIFVYFSLPIRTRGYGAVRMVLREAARVGAGRQSVNRARSTLRFLSQIWRSEGRQCQFSRQSTPHSR